MNIVAVRHPYWLPEINTGIPPTIKPGDWLLSSWLGNPERVAIKLDLYKWNEVVERAGWGSELPPLQLVYDFYDAMEYDYDEELLREKPWIEVLAFIDEDVL